MEVHPPADSESIAASSSESSVVSGCSTLAVLAKDVMLTRVPVASSRMN